jgi:hypothetical protein
MLVLLLRYHFNLTDGDETIRDEDGLELFDVQAAMLTAMRAIEELRIEDPSSSGEWQGWRLEIVDASGLIVRSIPLSNSSRH